MGALHHSHLHPKLYGLAAVTISSNDASNVHRREELMANYRAVRVEMTVAFVNLKACTIMNTDSVGNPTS
jgi:hypothetical protein